MDSPRPTRRRFPPTIERLPETTNFYDHHDGTRDPEIDYVQFYFLFDILNRVFLRIIFYNNQIDQFIREGYSVGRTLRARNFNFKRANIIIELLNKVFFKYLFEIPNEVFDQQEFMQVINHRGQSYNEIRGTDEEIIDMRYLDWIRLMETNEREFYVRNNSFVYYEIYFRYIFGILRRNLGYIFFLIARRNIVDRQKLQEFKMNPNYHSLFEYDVPNNAPTLQHLRGIREFLFSISNRHNLRLGSLINTAITAYSPVEDFEDGDFIYSPEFEAVF